MSLEDDSSDGFWLFGYGSLIWKPPPHYDKRVLGYIEGYVRRFWQASEDHRGTPEAPGRVVTLIERKHWETLSDEFSAPLVVWGAAYHFPASKVSEVRAALDLREINGYSIQHTPFHPPRDPSIASEPSPIDCLVYIGLPSNPQFVGPQKLQELAAHILRSRGPSGENREYLYMLDQALADLNVGIVDEHVRELAKLCRELEQTQGFLQINNVRTGAGISDLSTKPTSTDEQEEIEKPM